mmetsp:Transcript_14443/g.56975  ORF Transcript_14443/g.56975 Transcript_14443/m.56975 type:complete len:214 (-) Transcript_14443:107-748(-)
MCCALRTTYSCAGSTCDMSSASSRGSFVKNGCSSACAGVSRLSGSTTKSFCTRSSASGGKLSNFSSTVRRYAFSGLGTPTANPPPASSPAGSLIRSSLPFADFFPFALALSARFWSSIRFANSSASALPHSLKILWSCSTSVLPGKMGEKWSNSATMHPADHASSAAPSYALAPNRSSGGLYHSVTTRFVSGSIPRGSLLAKPKSASFRVPSS